jgi:hypothetical protein
MTEAFTATRFPHHSENVPEELKTDEAWVLCDESKAPLIAIGTGTCFAASSTDSETWRSYETALDAWRENEYSFAGIGRVIRATEEYGGVDLDDCLDPETSELSPYANRIVERLDSYSEISPSLTGVKIWTKAASLDRSYKKPGLEIYSSRRYFTITGLALHGSTKTIEDCTTELEALIAEEFPKVDRDRTPYEGPQRSLDLLDYLERAGIKIFAELSDGTAERKYAIRCPWSDEHTDGDESGTFAGQYANGATFFFCHHSHCGHRRWQGFRAYADPLVYLGRPRRTKGRLR